MDPRRAENVLTWLLDRRVLRSRLIHTALEAPWAAIRRVHTDDWLLQIDDPDTIAQVLGIPQLPVPADSVLELWRRGVGATIAAAHHTLETGDRCGTLMGGFHHAAPNRGAGFCALNDIAVAINEVRRTGFTGQITVLDFDAHPPDGLSEFTFSDVEIRSVGVASDWTTDGILDLRVPPGSTDRPYLQAVRTALRSLRTDLVFYIAGSDPLVGDPLGGLQVSPAGLRERDQLAMDAVGDTPLVVLPGGGYTRSSWKVTAHTFAEAAGSRARVSRTYNPVARRVHHISKSFPLFSEEPLITEADLGEMFGRPTERRFLGHFTRHGVEYALERYGILSALRRMGLEPLRVRVTTGEIPERLEIFTTINEQEHRVLDLKLQIRRVEGFDLLQVDWLELANPLSDRPTLPGQARPGLGIASEVGSILIETARRLRLSGVVFVPSRYHVAWIARTHAQFMRPDLQGRFEALLTYLEPVSLRVASEKLSGDGLSTEDAEPIVWTPAEMVHAIEPALMAYLEQHKREVRAARRGTELRFLPLSAVFSGIE